MAHDRRRGHNAQPKHTAASELKDRVQQRADELKGQAQQRAGELKDEAQQQAGPVVAKAQEHVVGRLEGQRATAAQSLGEVAHAMRQTSQQMRDQNQPAPTSYIDQAAGQVERLSGYLQDNDLGQVVGDVERFARRQPALFLGGAFVLGLIGARFLTSSRPAPQGDGSYRSPGTSYPHYEEARYATTGSSSIYRGADAAGRDDLRARTFGERLEE